jgi:hypothetical protein
MLWRCFQSFAVFVVYLFLFIVCAIVWLTVSLKAFHGVNLRSVWYDISEGNFNNF